MISQGLGPTVGRQSLALAFKAATLASLCIHMDRTFERGHLQQMVDIDEDYAWARRLSFFFSMDRGFIFAEMATLW